MNGTLLYKCRKCGKIERKYNVENYSGVIRAIVFGQEIYELKGYNLKVVDTHRCDDNNIGVSDLIGAEQDGQPMKINTTGRAISDGSEDPIQVSPGWVKNER